MDPQLEGQWREEGFAEWAMAGTFIPGFATVWFKTEAGVHRFRVLVGEDHLNGTRVAHGGFISTMADIWLGYNVALRMPAGSRFITSSLSVDFLKAAKPGQRLDSAIDRIKTGRRLCHAAGAILCDDEPLAAMRATFVVLDDAS